MHETMVQELVRKAVSDVQRAADAASRDPETARWRRAYDASLLRAKAKGHTMFVVEYGDVQDDKPSEYGGCFLVPFMGNDGKMIGEIPPNVRVRKAIP